MESVTLREPLVKKLCALILGMCVAMAALSARAQVSTNPNNTIVRFDISTGGTNLGNFDIELFDEDKPETVKNFLLYVYSGAYSNLLIHRLTSLIVTDSDTHLMQGGHVRLANPTSTNSLSDYLENKGFGRITNEFNVGPVLSNTFGTIGAAKISLQTNSASTDWYINVADNPLLDVTNGGYTVFGRIINTTAPNNGTNLLNFFASLTNLTFAILPREIFSPLPFSAYHYIVRTNTNGTIINVTTNIDFVQYRDLFTIHASVVRSGLTPERKAPRVALGRPVPAARTTNATVIFHGTASDDSEIARVTSDSAAGVRSADGTTSWTSEVPLQPGINRIQIRSVDRFGNQSKPITRNIFYDVNPYPRLRGTYVGLMTPATTNSGPRVTGMVTLNLGPRGIYNGRLRLLGVSYPIRGVFSSANTSVISGKRGKSPLVLVLNISTNGPAAISGQYSDGSESADVKMYRVEESTEAVSEAGEFTFIIAALTDSTLGEGFGFGNADVSESGGVNINAITQNGADLTETTTIHSGSHFPLFVRRNATEAVLGWMTFATNHNGFEGLVQWIKSDFFPTNSGEPLQVIGSRFLVSTTGENPLGWTNGVAELSGGNLTSPIQTQITLSGSEIIVASNSINLELSTDTNGQISGSFVHPVTQAVTPLRGVFVQNLNVGAGFFSGADRSGALRLRPLSQ